MRKGYFIAIGIALLAAALYTALFLGLGLHKRISTSVLDLVPKEQREPELEVARALVQSGQNRVLLIALQSDGAPISPMQRQSFVDALHNSVAFDGVFDVAGEQTVRGSAALFFDLRGELLLPAYLAAMQEQFDTAQTPAQAQTGQDATDERPHFADFLAKAAVAQLDDFLTTPEAMAYQQMVPRDPLLLVLNAFEKWRSANAGLFKQPPEDRLLVWAKLSASPFSAEGQQPVFDALDQALAAALSQAGAEEISLQSSGVSRFAQGNERGIRAEVAFFNIASISIVLLICALMLRSPSVLFHTVAVLSLSLPLAWLVTLLSFDSVPIIALVVGSILVGVTIDYCLHVFLDAGEKPAAPLLRPLLLSCGTTAVAFLALTLSPLPLLMQTGVFVATALVATCALALLYRRLLGHLIEARVRGDLTLRTTLRWKLPAAVLLAVLAIGISRIEWNDSVDNLQYPLPHLHAESAAVNAQFGAGDTSTFLSSGNSFAQAREALAALAQALPEGSQMTSIAEWTPRLNAYLQAGRFLRSNTDFAEKLTAALEAQGYESESFAPFFEALQQWQTLPYDSESYEALFRRLEEELPGPAGSMLGSAPNAKLLLSSGSVAGDAFTPPQGSVRIDTLNSLSGVFAHYRQNALALSLWGIAVLALGSMIVYGPKRGAKLLLVPCVAGFAALGTVGFLQGELNLFHLIGLFLGVCLALDYGAFALRSSGTTSIPYSVCVAAATSISAFLLLGLSRIPAVVALGSTVALCIAYAFIFALLLTVRQPRAANTTEN